MIEKARPSKPFHVVVMEQDDFIDLSPDEQELNKNSKLIKVSQGRWIQIRSDDLSQIRLRETHNLLETWTSDVILKTPRGRRPPQLETLYKVTDPLEFPKMYGGPLPISKGKKDDLLAMLELLSEENKTVLPRNP
ncbi:hypothetical protein J6590_101745, partial [Homalodisca vitripennis]